MLSRLSPRTVDILSFVVTVILAAALHWQARDIIWGLWASSLCFGYFYIVATIVLGVRAVTGAMRWGAAAGGLFLLAFFTVHFGMFHFVHSIFLNEFFPLVTLGSGFPNPLAILGSALHAYWPMVLMTFVSRFRDLPRQASLAPNKNTLMTPYANVIRMHLLIFVFAGLHFAGLSRFAVYPVLAAYFFPWRSVFPNLGKRKAAAA